MTEEHRYCGRTGKICYPSQHAAGAAKKMLFIRSRQAILAIYRCSVCGLWHLGRDKDKGRRKIRRPRPGAGQ